ncbi:MAG TPA: phosphatidylglycerophosphatase A [Candidatus Kapabacteria bacterium]|nr:phosphatidylglycerophosphatase A [Candidatus Kapabacteria bacterium]
MSDSSEERIVHDAVRFDWYGKARSRLWSKQPEGMEKIPPPALLIGTFFYTGLSPVASGTVGSIAAAALYYFLHGLQNPVALAIACIVVLVAGIWSGGVIERTLKIQDPGIVVIDEVLGQWIALFTIHYAGNLTYIVLSFVFFRMFDVIKVPPARYFDRREGGVGIMLDDVVAGIYALIAAHLVMLLF